jgi:hypothetical protein
MIQREMIRSLQSLRMTESYFAVTVIVAGGARVKVTVVVFREWIITRFDQSEYNPFE